jgi:hypothetical protein
MTPASWPGRVWSSLQRVAVVTGPVFYFLGVFLNAKDLAALGLPGWGWQALGGAMFVGAGALLYRDRAQEVGRLENQLRERGAPPVELTGLDPVTMGPIRRFRLRVYNGGDRRTRFYGRVVKLEGIIPGAEAAYDLGWRHGDNRRSVAIPAHEDQWIEFADVPMIDARAARRLPKEDHRWHPFVVFKVQDEEGSPITDHPSGLSGVTVPDDALACQVRALVRIWHEDSDELVAEKCVRLWFTEEDSLFVPHLEVEGATDRSPASDSGAPGGTGFADRL